MTDTRFKRIEKKKTQELISYDHSVWKDIKKELFSNKIALVSIIILLIIIIASILAPLSPYDPNKINVAEKLQGISAKHIFGTDEYGRDYFTRALYGGCVCPCIIWSEDFSYGWFLFDDHDCNPRNGNRYYFWIFWWKSGYVPDALHRYFPGTSEYASDGCTEYNPASGSVYSDRGTQSFFLGTGGENYKGGNHVCQRKRLCDRRKESGSRKFPDCSGTYCTEYYGTGHRSGKPWNCQCDSDGVVLKFPWTWSTDSKSFLGKYAAECAGTYSGCTETCGISGSSDSVYSTEFQFTW